MRPAKACIRWGNRGGRRISRGTEGNRVFVSKGTKKEREKEHGHDNIGA